MTAIEYMEVFEEEFFSRLRTKTGWGKNEVEKIFREAEIATMKRFAD